MKEARGERKGLCGLEVVIVFRVGDTDSGCRDRGRIWERGKDESPERDIPAGGRPPKRWKCRNSTAERVLSGHRALHCLEMVRKGRGSWEHFTLRLAGE